MLSRKGRARRETGTMDGRALQLKIDVAGALPSVGDHKVVEGSAEVVLRDTFDLEFRPGDGVSWSLGLRRIAGGLEIAGVLAGSMEMSCFRCLEEFSCPIELKIREHAVWYGDVAVEEDLETAPDYVVDGGVLDLEPVMRDAVALGLPVRRICREGCRGLCARCGVNLNTGTCSCGPAPVDERLSPLVELKKRLEREERER